ncbi:MAG: hypothetical protein A2W26_13245 [Acidobacteria bacterium RBG_16_64_8]|nr:MAG: hypothetical protein A2W26_13245 [Acidobacteria bacterium RBG_16_64_8]
MIEMSRAAVERREKRNAESRAWRAANPEKAKASVRATNLRKKFGLTPDQYETMLQEQGGGCWICGKEPGPRRLAVDHDHKTRQVRGLLCGNCNQGIGRLQDSPALLRRAAEYIERTRIQ